MSVYSVGGIIIDDETGEIVELPPEARGLQERIVYLTQRLAEAQRAERAWAQAAALYKKALLPLLRAWDGPPIRTDAGTPALRTRWTRSIRLDKLPAAFARHEVPRELADAVVRESVKSLDVELFAAALERHNVPPALLAEVLDETTTVYAQIAPLRPAPPVIEEVQQ